MSPPRYIDLPGNTVAKLPYLAHDATLHMLAFKGEAPILQRICNLVLNNQVGNDLRFHVVEPPFVVFTALYVPRMMSGDPIDKSKGYVKEGDIGLWIPVLGGAAAKPQTWRYFWLPVFLFVDSGAALSAGREVFGYPKSLGRFERVANGLDDDARVTVHTQHFVRFGPDQEAVVAPIFGIERVPSKGPPPPIPSEAELTDRLNARFLAKTRTRIKRPYEFTPYSGGIELPMIFLKQFRGLTRPSSACYQAVTTVDSKPLPDPEPTVKQLSDVYALRLWESDSHPIARDLGLTSGQEADPESSLQVSMDFTVGFGSVLWESK